MREYTINKYKKVIDIAMRKSLTDGFITRSDFDALTKEYKMTHTIGTYLERLNVIKRIDVNKFHFIRPVTVPDIKEMGAMQMTANIRNRQKNRKNEKQMTIETSAPKVNVITTDSDEFARQAMAYLESRGFKVTKEKFIFPIQTYKSGIKALTSNVYDDKFSNLVNLIAKMEIEHIRMAYRAGESGTYKSPEQYLKDEYNDFAA